MSDAGTAAVLSLISGLITSNVSAPVGHLIAFSMSTFLVLHRYRPTVFGYRDNLLRS